MDRVMQIKGLCAAYADKTVLSNINVDIYRNAITAVIGPSGCGKTTFIKSLNLLVEDEKDGSVKGSILLDGSDARSIPREKLRSKLGMVFQNPAPFPLSIKDNMTYAPRYHGIRDKERLCQIAKEKLQVAGLYEEVSHCLDMPAKKLSGGQQQRLCIARALTVEPSLLLLDEPCSALDIQNTAKIEAMLRELSKDYAIVIVTHNLAQARRIADYTMFMMSGELIEFGRTSELFSSPGDERTRQYIEGVFG
ncbi:phosphate ABC transporter ATP-binding protein, PhoT family [Peptoclostridium acidaminophilum DSM 3953]|uniref:Phosphate ABC transporter ATP-binding protein, PhoT family n=1 Tax=Peptoclostridium acidaminophilum DSM 3953 TaxID=1286171 RepID=W8U987_PEPAC|nr:phosphate ABC transporter ATP-binding protein [Peptoclostridium acidaminophilum]AHM57426.1 phosphate ABC transporter ATP-binding protein, PhoT family [Peptoclostridium acidaminophilum DSM 3953]